MARCAVCLLTFRNGDKYTLVDEFVVHRRCAGGTIVAREKNMLADRERAAQSQKLAEAKRQLDVERDENHQLRRRLNDAGDAKMGLLVDLEAARAIAAQRELELQNERRLRALAELEARTTRAPQVSTPPEEEQISSEPVDITAARFSLLELD